MEVLATYVYSTGGTLLSLINAVRQ